MNKTRFISICLVLLLLIGLVPSYAGVEEQSSEEGLQPPSVEVEAQGNQKESEPSGKEMKLVHLDVSRLVSFLADLNAEQGEYTYALELLHKVAGEWQSETITYEQFYDGYYDFEWLFESGEEPEFTFNLLILHDNEIIVTHNLGAEWLWIIGGVLIFPSRLRALCLHAKM